MRMNNRADALKETVRAKGIVRRGSRTSPEFISTASKPENIQTRMNTPLANDAGPGFAADENRAGLIKKRPATTKSNKGASLPAVKILPATADSRTPIRLMTVSATINTVMTTARHKPEDAAGQK